MSSALLAPSLLLGIINSNVFKDLLSFLSQADLLPKVFESNDQKPNIKQTPSTFFHSNRCSIQTKRIFIQQSMRNFFPMNVSFGDEQHHISTLPSVRYMRLMGWCMIIAMVIIYTFLVLYATYCRKQIRRKAKTKSASATTLPPAGLPSEIRIRQVQKDLGVEVAVMDEFQDAKKKKKRIRFNPWSCRNDDNSSSTTARISPSSSGIHTVILEGSSSDSPKRQCNTVHVINDPLADVEGAPSDEDDDDCAGFALPENYYARESCAAAPRSAVPHFNSPSSNISFSHDISRQTSNITLSTSYCSDTSPRHQKTDLPSDEDDEDDEVEVDFVHASWKTADGSATKEVVSHFV